MATESMGNLVLPIIATLVLEPTDVPPPPDPSDSTHVASPTVDPFEDEVDEDDGRFEIGGFMKRPPPRVPASPEEEVEMDSRLVWGLHRPVAPWKRRGLVASAALAGAATVTAVAVFPVGQRKLDLVWARVEELRARGQSVLASDPLTACSDNLTRTGFATHTVDDVTLAYRCQSFRQYRTTYKIAVGVAAVSVVSTVVFGVLHLVRRVETPRRIEARADGFALRF